MSQIEVGGQLYRTGKMEPRQQFHVMRRLSPLIAQMGNAALGFLDDTKEKDEVIGDMMAMIGPTTELLSMMPDKELDYVLNACLLKAERMNRDTNTWHPTHVADRGGLLCMFKDIDLSVELRLVGEVVKENLSGFFGQLNEGSASSISARPARAVKR